MVRRAVASRPAASQRGYGRAKQLALWLFGLLLLPVALVIGAALVPFAFAGMLAELIFKREILPRWLVDLLL